MCIVFVLEPYAYLERSAFPELVLATVRCVSGVPMVHSPPCGSVVILNSLGGPGSLTSAPEMALRQGLGLLWECVFSLLGVYTGTMTIGFVYKGFVHRRQGFLLAFIEDQCFS